jgi:hypothetical protein
MASKISVIIDVAVDQANRGLKSFKQSITDADGAAGKLKAGASSAFTSIKANAGDMAVVAAAAIAGFAVKAVDAFSDTALSAAHLRDALGLTAEEASRLMEVAGDLDIPVDALEQTIGRMNVTASKSPKFFDDIGAAIVRNKDGTTNVNETFLATVDALNKIPDASKRAEAAQQIFGRGWKQIAELVGSGADVLRGKLEDVSDVKVISDKEIQQAKKLRDAMKDLGDRAEDAKLRLGQALLPVIAETAEDADRTAGFIEKLANKIPGLSTAFGLVTDNAQRMVFWPKYILDAKDAFDSLFGSVDEGQVILEANTAILQANAIEKVKGAGAAAALAAATGEYSDETEDATDSTDDFAEALEDARSQWDQLLGRLNVSDAFRNIQNGFDDLEDAAFDAFVAASEGAADAEEKGRIYQQKIDDMTRAVLEDFIPALGSVPKEVTSSIVALIDEGKFAEAERRMARLTAARNAIINVYAQGKDPRLVSGARASGGPVGAGRTYLVGEKGPELLQMGSSSGNVIPNNKIGGGGQTIVNVYPQIGTDELKLAKYIREVLAKGDRNGGAR